MSGNFADRVKETSSSTGTGNLTLTGADPGYQTFNTAFGTNRGFRYCIEEIDADGLPTGNWEVGDGYLSDATTFVRVKVLASSNSDALVNFAGVELSIFNPFSGLAARKSTHGFDLQYGMP